MSSIRWQRTEALTSIATAQAHHCRSVAHRARPRPLQADAHPVWVLARECLCYVWFAGAGIPAAGGGGFAIGDRGEVIGDRGQG